MRAREFIINVPITISINGNDEPEVAVADQPASDETEMMLAPQQQTIELLKKAAGVQSVYDQNAPAEPVADKTAVVAQLASRGAVG